MGRVETEKDADRRATRMPGRSSRSTRQAGTEPRAPPDSEARIPHSIPLRPPNMLKVIASMRNCRRISPGRADRDANADFARPLGHAHQHDVHDPDPPTTREIPATAPSSSVMVAVTELTVSAISFWLRMLKSLSWPAGRRWRCRSRFVIACLRCPCGRH